MEDNLKEYFGGIWKPDWAKFEHSGYKLIEKINVHRNHKILHGIKRYKCLQEHKNYLEQILESVMAINFSSLKKFHASEVSDKKQLLYHEALNGIL